MSNHLYFRIPKKRCILVHPYSNRPLTESEPGEPKGDSFNKIIIKVPKYTKICVKSLQLLHI